MVCKESLLGYTLDLLKSSNKMLWFARNRCSDILFRETNFLSVGYGLQGIAARIYSNTLHRTFAQAMVCKESLLGYTPSGPCSWSRFAMVCKESLLGYTYLLNRFVNYYAMVCKESLLGYTKTKTGKLSGTAMVCKESLLGYTTKQHQKNRKWAMVCKESLLGYTYFILI